MRTCIAIMRRRSQGIDTRAPTSKQHTHATKQPRPQQTRTDLHDATKQPRMRRTCISASRPRYEKAKATTHARTQASIAPSRRSRGSDVHAHLYGAHATEQPRQRDTHTPARRPTKQPRHRHTRAHLRASHPRDEQQPTRTPARNPRDEAAKAATHVHTPARRPRDEAAKASTYTRTHLLRADETKKRRPRRTRQHHAFESQQLYVKAPACITRTR